MRYTEQQVSSELLDQPPFAGEPKKVFICSTPRSGSYLLCRYMINAGLGVPHEYFNPIIMREMAPRLGLASQIRKGMWRRRTWKDHLLHHKSLDLAEERFLENYLSALVPRRCQGGIFAAKIHYVHYVKVLDNQTGRRLLDGGVFVHLYRENLLKQAVSAHFSNLTGRWGIDETAVTVPEASPDFFDFAAMDHTLQGLAAEDLGWRVFLARNGIAALSISYEELRRDPFAFVVAIARRLGVPPESLRTGYSETNEPAETEGAGLPSKVDVAKGYVAAFRKVKDAPLPSTVAPPPPPARLREAGE